MSLTTARLDDIEEHHRHAFAHSWAIGDDVLWSEVIEAARESVARQECCEAGDKPGLVSLTEHSAPGGGSQWEADWLVPFHFDATSEFRPTPAAAYLALRDALAARKP